MSFIRGACITPPGLGGHLQRLSRTPTYNEKDKFSIMKGCPQTLGLHLHFRLLCFTKGGIASRGASCRYMPLGHRAETPATTGLVKRRCF